MLVKKFLEGASPMTSLVARWLILAGAVVLAYCAVNAAKALLNDKLAPYNAVVPMRTGTLPPDARLLRARGRLVCVEPQRARISSTSAGRPGARDAIGETLLLREAAWQLCAARVAGALTKEQYANALLALIARGAAPATMLPQTTTAPPVKSPSPNNGRPRAGISRRQGTCRCINQRRRAAKQEGLLATSAQTPRPTTTVN